MSKTTGQRFTNGTGSGLPQTCPHGQVKRMKRPFRAARTRRSAPSPCAPGERHRRQAASRGGADHDHRGLPSRSATRESSAAGASIRERTSSACRRLLRPDRWCGRVHRSRPSRFHPNLAATRRAGPAEGSATSPLDRYSPPSLAPGRSVPTTLDKGPIDFFFLQVFNTRQGRDKFSIYENTRPCLTA